MTRNSSQIHQRVDRGNMRKYVKFPIEEEICLTVSPKWMNDVHKNDCGEIFDKKCQDKVHGQ